jgi:uncharacterized protein (DUF342 family)
MANNANQDNDSNVIHEDKQDAYDLRIETHNNQLECLASIKVHDQKNSITPAALISLLKHLNIVDTLDLEKVAVFCTKAAQEENPQKFLLAKGKDATTGIDGTFELRVHTAAEERIFSTDEQDKIDYKAVQTFTNIEPDQVIGVIIPPGIGLPGITVTGLTIPAREGNPVNLILGEGIKKKENSDELLAAKSGRVVLESNRIFITEEFIVKGDVDLSIGNINFNGFVKVSGDVLDDFDIKATKGIQIDGAVGACLIESGGPVSVGSMAGMGIGLIRCQGDFQARYLNHATVECWGNVIVTSEIRNSIVKATGAVLLSKGNVTGGQIVAMEGIEAKTIGTRAGTKTHLVAGIYFPETDRLQFLRTRVKSAVYQVKRIQETLQSLKTKQLETMRKPLRDATELRIGVLSQRQTNLDNEREAFTQELATFESKDHPTANAKINALTAIKEGAIITLGETTEEIKLELNGPVSIIENNQQNGLRFLTYSPLKISAEQLEKELEAEDAV